jgi:CRP-like cAMP-binding protein
LFWQDEQQTHKIDILQGVVRAVRLLENGNRQILAFYWPGDTVYPSKAACQQFTAEAVTNCRVACFPAPIPCRQSGPCEAQCGVQQVFNDTLTLVTTIGQLNIQQRIAWFLLRIRRHLPADPRFPHTLRILIPRADIADHLGTSMETVCRTLADFREKKLIDLPNRKTVRFVNIPGLKQVVGD